jgi:hypothetical protein
MRGLGAYAGHVPMLTHGGTSTCLVRHIIGHVSLDFQPKPLDPLDEEPESDLSPLWRSTSKSKEFGIEADMVW